MPAISKVQPITDKNGQTTVSLDDPMAGAVSATRMKRATSNVVIYGRNRCGKTTLASLFPKPLLLVSYEPCQGGGAESIRGTPGVTIIQMRSRDHAIRLASRLKSDSKSNWRRSGDTWQEMAANVNGEQVPSFVGEPFATVVKDSCTSLQDLILKEILGLDSLPVQLKFGRVSKDQYQDRSARAKEVIQMFRDLPMNTVFLALEKDFGDKEWGGGMSQKVGLGSHFAADMGEATVKWLINACDYVCQLSVVPETRRIETEVVLVPGDPVTKQVSLQATGRTVHRLRTMFDPHYSAGFRSSVPEAVPQWIECQSPQAMYDDMVKVMGGQRATHGHYPEE